MNKISRYSLLAFVGLLCLISSCKKDNVEPLILCDGSLSILIDDKDKGPDCATHDGFITVSAAGGVEPYQFSLNGGTKQPSSTFSALSAGVYSVTVIDANNCEDVLENILLEVVTTLSVTPTVTPDSNCSLNNGSISLSGTGGSGTLNYKLGTGAYSTTTNYSGLAPGTYSVSVKDDSGCEKTISVEVTQGNTGITYTGNIAAIINSNCTNSNCHGSGSNRGPGDLTDYEKVKSAATNIFNAVNSGRMPQGADKLSDSQIALISCWISDGKPN